VPANDIRVTLSPISLDMFVGRSKIHLAWKLVDRLSPVAKRVADSTMCICLEGLVAVGRRLREDERRWFCGSGKRHVRRWRVLRLLWPCFFALALLSGFRCGCGGFCGRPLSGIRADAAFYMLTIG